MNSLGGAAAFPLTPFEVETFHMQKFESLTTRFVVSSFLNCAKIVSRTAESASDDPPDVGVFLTSPF